MDSADPFDGMFSEFIHDAVNRFRNRAGVVFLVIHAGLILAVYGLASLPQATDPSAAVAWRFLVAGIAGLYGGVLLAAFFVVWPLYALVRKVRKLLRWREWILQELPRILALVPTVVQAFRGMTQPGPASGPAPAAQPAAATSAPETVGAGQTGSGFPPAA